MYRSRNIVVITMAILFIFLLMYTSARNSMPVDGLRTSADQTSLNGVWPALFRWSIIAIEVFAVTSLLIPSQRRYGLAFSVIVMVIFAVFALVMLLFSSILPLYLSGIFNELSRHNQVFAVLFLTTLIGIVLLRRKKETKDNSALHV